MAVRNSLDSSKKAGTFALFCGSRVYLSAGYFSSLHCGRFNQLQECSEGKEQGAFIQFSLLLTNPIDRTSAADLHGRVLALVSTQTDHHRMILQAKPYVTNVDTYDVNAVLAALFLGVLILILFFVVSLILLLK